MSEELIEEIDWEGNVLDVHPRSMMKKRMFPHKASLVIPRGVKGGFIFAKRASDKEPFPGTWVCGIGGKASQGESVIEAAKREALEEARLDADLVPVTSFKYDDPKYMALFSVFTTAEGIDIDDLVPDVSEIDYFKEFSLDEMKKLVLEDPESCAPTFRVALRAFVEGLETQ